MNKLERREKMNEKIQKLSHTIVDYSLNIKENDRVLITSITNNPSPLIKALIEEITKKKAIPFVRISDPEIEAKLLENTSDKRIEEIKIHEEQLVDNYDCFINTS